MRGGGGMKTIFLALSVMVILVLGIGSTQAGAPGVRDLSPGSEFVCYFLVSKARVDTGAGPSTLFKISEVKGQGEGTATSPWSRLSYNFYTIDSVLVYDYGEQITRWATHLRDIGKLIEGMSEQARASLAVTFEDEPYYAGYIVVSEVQYPKVDNIIADVYQLDLSRGLAAESNIPVKQYAVGLPSQIRAVRTDDSETGSPSATGIYERWTGDALACATNRIWGGTVDYGAAWFAVYPRYLINDTSGKTYWIIWRSSVRSASTGGLLQGVAVGGWVINGAEDYRSTGFQLREMSIIDAGANIPSGLKVSYPYIGVLNLTPYTNMEVLGWNWELANNGAATSAINWAGMSLMAVDAATTGSGYHPSH